MIATTPIPPYYAVIFSSQRTAREKGYGAMGKAMVELATKQEGFLGIESVREEIGITISYWQSLEAIQRWKNNSQHLVAQEKGKTDWYKAFKVRIALVERDYDFGM